MVSHADGRSYILLNAAHTLSIHTHMFFSPGEDSYMDGTLHIKVLQEIQPSRLYQQEWKEPLLQKSTPMQRTDPGYKWESLLPFSPPSSFTVL